MCDEYSKRCIEWLRENNIGTLKLHINRVQGANVDISTMGKDDVISLTLTPRRPDEYNVWKETNIKCPGCQMANVKYREAQTRGADEGASVYYMCVSCLYLWNS